MSLEENLELSIKTIDDLLRCVNLASLLELSGWPKPGNIHRTKDFKETRFEHFLAGISAIQPNFRELCENTYNTYKSETISSSFVKLGKFFEEASMNMMRWQKGGNVLLGHILILAPLVAAAASKRPPDCQDGRTTRNQRLRRYIPCGRRRRGCRPILSLADRCAVRAPVPLLSSGEVAMVPPTAKPRAAEGSCFWPALGFFFPSWVSF